MTDIAAVLQQAVAASPRPRHAPDRLQLGPGLTFDQVAALGPYLVALGVSEADLSPCFRCGEERVHEREIITRRLAALVEESAEIRELIDDNIRIFDGTPAEPSRFDLLDRLLSAHTYRLADWRVADDEVNGLEVTARDRDDIERAVAEATRRLPTVNVSVFDFVRDTLLLRYPPGADKVERAERRHFVMRFQQTTGPVTAKGVDPNLVSDAADRTISRFASVPVALLERERSS